MWLDFGCLGHPHTMCPRPVMIKDKAEKVVVKEERRVVGLESEGSLFDGINSHPRTLRNPGIQYLNPVVHVCKKVYSSR